MGPMFSFALGPTDSLVTLDGNILKTNWPETSNMHIKKAVFLESLGEQ